LAPLIHSVKGKDIMPYDDPRWMGGIGMIGTKAVYNAVMHCDVLLMLGTDPAEGAFDRRRCRAGTADNHEARSCGKPYDGKRVTILELPHQNPERRARTLPCLSAAFLKYAKPSPATWSLGAGMGQERRHGP
jgi:thiamine pyrophosphate-dependent enzyme